MGGVFVVPVTLNGTVRSHFVVDSGAANVQVPQDVADELGRNDTLKLGDYLGERRFVVADGRGLLQRTIRLRSVQVGDRTMENVLAVVGPREASRFSARACCGASTGGRSTTSRTRSSWSSPGRSEA
jgi:predicted aspartyl protease